MFQGQPEHSGTLTMIYSTSRSIRHRWRSRNGPGASTGEMRLLHQASPSEGAWNEQRGFSLSAPLASPGHQHLGSCSPSSYTCPLPSSHSFPSQLSLSLSPSCCHRHVDTLVRVRHQQTSSDASPGLEDIFGIVCVDAEQLKQRF